MLQGVAALKFSPGIKKIWQTGSYFVVLDVVFHVEQFGLKSKIK